MTQLIPMFGIQIYIRFFHLHIVSSFVLVFWRHFHATNEMFYSFCNFEFWIFYQFFSHRWNNEFLFLLFFFTFFRFGILNQKSISIRNGNGFPVFFFSSFISFWRCRFHFNDSMIMSHSTELADRSWYMLLSLNDWVRAQNERAFILAGWNNGNQRLAAGWCMVLPIYQARQRSIEKAIKYYWEETITMTMTMTK